MDGTRLQFLFGTDDPTFDVDDDDELTEFFASELVDVSDDEEHRESDDTDDGPILPS